MPITKQAIKRVRQAKVRTARNKHYNSQMKSMIKLFLSYIQKKELDNAKEILSKVVSSIDTCCKKNLIHKNNAARKKARLDRVFNGLGGKTATKKTEKK